MVVSNCRRLGRSLSGWAAFVAGAVIFYYVFPFVVGVFALIIDTALDAVWTGE